MYFNGNTNSFTRSNALDALIPGEIYFKFAEMARSNQVEGIQDIYR